MNRYEYHFKILLIVIVICVCMNPGLSYGQQIPDVQRQYQRKSISYIPTLPITPEAKRQLTETHLQFLSRSVRDFIEMPRFDFNEVPEPILQEFYKRARRERQLTSEELSDILSETVLPPMVDVVQTQAEIRARNLVTEEQKQQFIATKAQDYGVTSEQLQQVMNSAYLYFPYLDQFSVQKSGDNYSCSLSGGIIWYKVEMLTDTPSVKIMHQETASGTGGGNKDQSYYFRGGFISGDDFAVYSAVDNFSRSLQSITQSIPEFQLFGQVEYVRGRWLEFNLGREMGVQVDDGFFIGEQVMKPDSTLTTRKVGFVRTTSVGRMNQDEFSYSRAAAITGRQFAKGMTVIEHPRMPLDFVMKIQSTPIEIEAGGLAVQWLNGRDELETIFPETYSGDALGLDLEVRYHLGRHFDIPMLLFTVGGAFSSVPTDIQVRSFGGSEWLATQPALFQGRIGIEKKYFFRRLGFTLGGSVGYSRLSASQDVFGFDFETHSVGLSNSTIGLSANIGLEFVLTPDFHAGAYTGFQAYPGSSSWSLDVDDESYELLTTPGEDYPRFRNLGTHFGLYFHYQLPALPFNPLNVIQSLSAI